MDFETNKKLSSYVFQWLKNKRLSQKELALFINVSAPTFNQMLHGTAGKSISIQKLIQIISFLQPEQFEIDEVFKIILLDTGLDENSFRIVYNKNVISKATLRENCMS